MSRRTAGLLIVILELAGVAGCATLFQTSHSKCAGDLREHVVPPEPTPASTVGTLEEEVVHKTQAPAAPQGPMPPLLEVTPAQFTREGPPDKIDQAGKRAPLVEALQCVLDDRHQDALRHLQAYDQETQEFYLRVLPTLTIFAKKKLNELSPQEVAVLNDSLSSLQATLRAKAELVIEKMCYCEWVKAFGVYKPLAENRPFLASTREAPGDLVQLYVEPHNIASVSRGKFFETKVRSSLEIRDAKGEKTLWARSFDEKDEATPLKSWARINDHHHVYCFYVPPEVPPGTYQLIVQLVDETIPEARRVVRKAIELRVTPVASRVPSSP